MNTQYTIADLMKEHRARAITRMEQQALKDIERYILPAIATAESRIYEGVFIFRQWLHPFNIDVQLQNLPFPEEGEVYDTFEMDIEIDNEDKYIMFLGDALKNMGFNVIIHRINYDYGDGIEIRLT